jgi:hypothetical protein
VGLCVAVLVGEWVAVAGIVDVAVELGSGLVGVMVTGTSVGDAVGATSGTCTSSRRRVSIVAWTLTSAVLETSARASA